MKKELLQKSLTSKAYRVLALTTALLFLLPRLTNAQSVSFGLEFGTPQSNGGPCVGKGGCQQVFDFDVSTNTYASDPNAVTVTFQVAGAASVNSTSTVSTGVANIDSIVPVDSSMPVIYNNALTMTFSMSELSAKQPDQVAYFTDPSQTYPFDASYPLTTPIFAPLNLLPDASVEPTDATSVAINGDQVVVTIYYSYSAGKNSNPSVNNAQTTAGNSGKCTLIPNPATDMLTLTPNDSRATNYSITNLVGQVVGDGPITSAGKAIDVSMFPSGMYLVNLFAGSNKMETLKFVKQ